MTKRDFALLLVRLLGLYIVATAFNSLQWLTSFTAPFAVTPTVGSAVGRLLLLLSPFGLKVLFGAALWIFASALASAMTSDLSEGEPISQWQPREVARLGLVIIGLFSLLQSVASIGQFLVQASVYSGTGLNPPGTSIFSLLTCIPSTLTGLILIFGARFLSYWIAPRSEFAPSSIESSPDAAD